MGEKGRKKEENKAYISFNTAVGRGRSGKSGKSLEPFLAEDATPVFSGKKRREGMGGTLRRWRKGEKGSSSPSHIWRKKHTRLAQKEEMRSFCQKGRKTREGEGRKKSGRNFAKDLRRGGGGHQPEERKRETICFTYPKTEGKRMWEKNCWKINRKDRVT